jgi:LCP family protein required for cell wall assembly
LLILAVAGFGLSVWTRIDRVHVQFPGSPPGGTTYLLIGSDSRDFVQSPSDKSLFGVPAAADGQRADIMLLVRQSADGSVRVLSVPRDLMTQFPDGSPVRMTLTLQQGPQAVVDTLCQSLGIGVNHLVLVHFDGLRRLVDRAGGVDVTTERALRDTVTGLDIPHGGLNHLDGSQALAYVRSRHTEILQLDGWHAIPPTADERSDRARAVLGQLGSRMHLSATAPLSSIEKVWALSGAITVDDHASPFVLRDIAHTLGRISTAPESRLPVTFHPGDIPTADLQRGAAGVVTKFQGGATPGCALRTATDNNPSGGTP